MSGKLVKASSIALGWFEPPYVPEGADPATYWANDPLWRAGYLDVTKYHGNGGAVDPSGRQISTVALQRAINDAHKANGKRMNLAVFFPPGTYLIDDTLKFYNTECWSVTTTQVVVGSTLESGRPTIRLVQQAPGFGGGKDVGATKPMAHLWNEWWGAKPCGGTKSPGRDYDDDRGYDNLYAATVRNFHFDCNNNRGCIGVRYAGAQWTSLEDVSVDATGAFAGFRNLPADGGYSVNLSVNGGRYGIYADHGSTATIAGLVLSNQTDSAIFVGRGWDSVLNVVGFAITKAYGPVIRTHASWNAGAGTLALVDGWIEVLGGRVAIDNSLGRTIALNNVYVSGARNLIQSAAQPALSGSAGWTRIREYSYCERESPGERSIEIHTVIDGRRTCGEHSMIARDVAPPPDDLATRHSWSRHPTFQDADVCDARDYGAGGMDSVPDSKALQTAIDTCESGKVFLPKGEYILDATLVLRQNSEFFGVSRAATHISAGLNGWNGDPHGPKSESPMITTDEDPDGTATTWLSTMRISPDESRMDESKLYLGMLHWKAGRRSMVSGVMFKRYGWLDETNKRTRAHTWIRISRTGGGRWYGLSTDEAPWRMQHPDFHAMQVTDTAAPLSIYNFNPESVSGNPAFLFSNVSNLRVYNQKTEGVAATNWLVVQNSRNIGWYGSGASVLDDKAPGYKVIDSKNLAFWNLLPRMGYDTGTIIEQRGRDGLEASVAHDPKGGYTQTGIALYKSGQLDDEAMDHGPGVDLTVPPPRSTWLQVVAHWLDEAKHVSPPGINRGDDTAL